MVFRRLCVRSVYSQKSIVDTASHVKDEKIMTPLLEAKENWSQKPIEKVSIPFLAGYGLGGIVSMFKGENKLVADLLIHSQFNKNKTIAILVHGFTDSSSGMAYLADSYHKRKISTLSINLRSHGESSGSYCGLGSYMSDGKDIASWVQYLVHRFGDDTKIVLHGVSMGGASVIQAAFKYSIPVCLVVSDCAFSSFSKNVKNMIQSFFPKNWVSTFFIAGIYASASFLNFVANGFFLGKSNPQNTLLKNDSTNKTPLLLFHGENDTLVKPLCAHELFAAAKMPKKLILVKEAPHIGSWFYECKKYMNEVFCYLRD